LKQAPRPKRKSARQEILHAAVAEAIELADRLELGDAESVRAWFKHHYPTVIGRVIENGDLDDFISSVREIAKLEPGQFEQAMREVLAR